MKTLDQLAIHTNFGVWDWLIVVVFLVVSTGLGLWARKYIKDMTDYVVAGRAVRTYLGIATMIASEMGLVTVMYSAQKGFNGGFAAFHIAFVAFVVSLIVGLTGFIVVPLRKMGVMTIPEFYEKRFGRGARLLGGAILAFSGILNMGMFLKADSLFVTTVMGMYNPIQLKLAMTIMLALVLLYTMLGGMIAVLLTDYMQFVVMAAGLLATSVLLMAKFQWSDIIHAVHTLKGDAGFNPFAQGDFGVGYVIWMTFLAVISCSVWQTSVMRATSAENTKVVRRTYSWSSIGFLIRFLIPYFWGICALIYIAARPDLRAIFLPAPGHEPPGYKELTLRAMPVALSSLMPAGAIGLLTAGMLAAAMSTYNTYLHCWSAVLTQDVVGPIWGHKLTPQKKIKITQGIMCVIGVFLLVWGLWYPLGEDLWDYMAVTGAIYFTGAFAILLAGIYILGASRIAAYATFICGFSAVIGLHPVQQLLGVDWRSEYVGLGTVCFACVTMFLGSVLFPDREKLEGATSYELWKCRGRASPATVRLWGIFGTAVSPGLLVAYWKAGEGGRGLGFFAVMLALTAVVIASLVGTGSNVIIPPAVVLVCGLLALAVGLGAAVQAGALVEQYQRRWESEGQ